MYMTTKSCRCSISWDTSAWAASTSSSSSAGVQAVPMSRPADRLSKHNTVQSEPNLTFRINYSRKTHGITQIVAQEFDAAENLTERALEVNVACFSPKSSRINPAALAAPRNERLSFF